MVDTVRGDNTSTEAIVIGGTVTGTLETSGDQDWYRIELLAGYQYQFDLRGAFSAGGTLTDPALELFDSAGMSVDFNDDIGAPNTDARLPFKAQVAGTYFLAAEG
ncbi:MAG: PPC domain-containing protein, partial [Betaproteobacteria bacterium]